MLKVEESKVVETIKNRRSIKKFKSSPIDKEVIIDLLNDAVWAPNHGVREPWRFMLFMGEGKEAIVEALLNECERGKLSTKNPDKLIERYRHIPAHLVVVMEESEKKKIWEEDFAATSALIQNLQLLGWEQGIGMIWKTNQYINSSSFCEDIGVKEGEKIVGIIHMGYPEEIPKAQQRTKAEEKITVIDKKERL
ncbi:nitroreductase [Halobacillus andaensis]|uniref:Putative NAD(P)H nitroreductase n=1 Tax=Halobacillus andaensis TaxID=1176239 RepID=A0A917B898_HALAA|nr:nitroreductase [Halobacillus andaensis]MBP2005160.1 nitroreductase [Halobacillus andaensis]GGF29291.1 nitroreductase [Halobacillus andaensis]